MKLEDRNLTSNLMTAKGEVRFSVIFRVRHWDEDVEKSFEALKHKVEFGELWVVPDETNGIVEVPVGVRKFSIHASMLDGIGLPKRPEDNIFWYNNDYGLYLFQQAHPGFEYYVIVEHDAVPTFKIDALIKSANHLKLDFVAMPIEVSDEQWGWLSTCAQIWAGDLVRPHLLCFCVVAGRAIPSLMAARRAHADRFARGEIREWPFAEGFVATHLLTAGFQVGDLSRFVEARDYGWWPPTHYNQVSEMPLDETVHPILFGQRYIDSLLKYDDLPPSSWFTPGSVLRRKLDVEPEKPVIEGLTRALIDRDELDFVFCLEDFCREPPSAVFVALLDKAAQDIMTASESRVLSDGKEAFTSSSSSWPKPDSREGASDALMREADGTYVINTSLELNPWWIVDLGHPCLIDRITVYNRLDAEAERSNSLTIWTSTNARRWKSAFERSSDLPFDGRDGRALDIMFGTAPAARFIRVEAMGITALHLDKIVVNGWKIPTMASHKPS